jgi:hypothetical protein
MATSKISFYEQLYEISKGEVDLFREATDAFLQAAESTNFDGAPSKGSTAITSNPSK